MYFGKSNETRRAVAIFEQCLKSDFFWTKEVRNYEEIELCSISSPNGSMSYGVSTRTPATLTFVTSILPI